MIINEGTYLVNSLGEKYIYSDKFVLHAFKTGWFKQIFTNIKSVKDIPDDEDENENNETADEDNG